MLASSRIREVEHRSASACTYESSTVSITPDAWTIKSPDDADDEDDATTTKCSLLSPGTTIRVAPMERATSGWSTEHFHQNLKLPDGSNVGRGIIVQFEAMARECVAIALSPYHQYELGKTYVVHFGANGNLQTVIRRHVNYNEAVDLTFPSRVCSENHWIPYWVCLQNGKLSAGVGKCVGKDVIGTLDDSMYNMLRSGVDAVRYVGLGNSALNRNARDLRVRNVRVMSIPAQFGLEGVPMEAQSAFVNILDMQYTNSAGAGGGSESGGGLVPTDAELLAEYEKERAKAKARAQKFGIEYKEPAPDAFLKWSEARRLRANPERGFITGIDTFSAEEKAKADARKERFAKEERKRKGMDDENGDNQNDGSDNEGGDGDGAMVEDDDGVDDVAEWEKTKKDPLPIEQAWENWKLVSRFRADPPDFGDKGEIVLSLAANGDGSGMETAEFIPKKIVIVPTKIHIFSIDWAPFKQIRTDDLLSYFRDYGPSYVEWLGELSCNILFEDKHSAARAFHALSQELPSPPPDSVDITKRWEPPSGQKNDEDMNDENAADGEANEVDDNADPSAQPADEKKMESDEEDEQEPLPDFGGMGWRFCKWTVRKVNNDRYGRRGTRARVLMRLATSLDVLDDRPTEWPKPPPGFTTKRVLMPWHDFSGKRRREGKRDTKRRRRSDGKRRGRGNGNKSNNSEQDLDTRLAQGLSSGRAGFSVEEIEAERNAKNAEVLYDNMHLPLP